MSTDDRTTFEHLPREERQAISDLFKQAADIMAQHHARPGRAVRALTDRLQKHGMGELADTVWTAALTTGKSSEERVAALREGDAEVPDSSHPSEVARERPGPVPRDDHCRPVPAAVEDDEDLDSDAPPAAAGRWIRKCRSFSGVSLASPCPIHHARKAHAPILRSNPNVKGRAVWARASSFRPMAS